MRRKLSTVQNQIETVKNRIDRNEKKVKEDKELLKDLEQELYAIKGKNIFERLEEMGGDKSDLEKALDLIREDKESKQEDKGVNTHDENNTTYN